MVDVSDEDLILLCLSEADELSAETGTAVSVTDLSDALDVGAETMAERVQLLSSLSTLESRGEIEKRGGDGDEVGYVLTANGRETAERLRQRLEGEEIDVRREGDVETISLSSAGEFFEDLPVTKALARLSADGVLRLDDERGQRFVDRDEELARARSIVEAVDDGACRTVLVAGKEGVGKTAFADEVGRFARERGFETYDGTSRRDIDDPYGPVREALAPVIDDRPDVEDPFERETVSLADEDAYEAQRTALFFEVVEAFETAAADGPLMALLDDLHWADAATVALLETLAERVEAPALFVGTYRTEDLTGDHPLSELVEGWSDEDRVARIELSPFGREHTRELIEWHLDTHDVPQLLVDSLYDQTGGNALFVEESVKRLRADGRIDPDAGVYPEDPEAIPVPDRVETAIDVRLDTLDETGRRILERIALADGGVSPAVVSETIDVAPSRVREYVEVLVDSRILERENDRVRFVIDAIEETLRGRIDDDRRRELHDGLATAIVSLAEDPADRATDVAYHRERAGDREAAIDWYREAAEQAEAVYAQAVAVDRYERALELARELDRREQVLSIAESLAEVQFLSGDYENARRYFQYVQERSENERQRRRAARYRSNMCHEIGEADEAVRIAEEGLAGWDGEQPDPEVCRLLIRKAQGLHMRGDVDEARELLDDALAMAREVGDDALVGRALHHVSFVEIDRGEDPDETEGRLQREIDMLEGAGERRLLSKAYNNLAIVRMRNGDLPAAREALERCLQIQEAIGDELSANITRGNLGIVYLREGDLEGAEEIHREAVESARRLGDRDTQATAHDNLGDTYERMGDFERAREQLERSIETYERTDNEGGRVHVEADLAFHLHLRGELDAALDRAERAAEAAAEVGGYQHELALGVLGVVQRARGDVEAAIETHQRDVEVAGDLGVNERTVDSCLRLGETYLEAGQIEDAADALGRARESVSEMVDPWRSLRVIRAHGRCKLRRGDLDGAERDLREALSIARDLGGRVEEAWCLSALGEYHRRCGADDDADERFREGADLASSIGAELIEAQCRERLRAGAGE